MAGFLSNIENIGLTLLCFLILLDVEETSLRPFVGVYESIKWNYTNQNNDCASPSRALFTDINGKLSISG